MYLSCRRLARGVAFCAALLLFPGTALAQPSTLLNFTTTDSSSDSGASIRLAWSYPSDGTPFNHYEYRVSTDGGAMWKPDWTVVPGSDTSTIRFNLTGRTYGIEYTFQLRAVAATPGSADVPGPAATATGTPLRPAPTNLQTYPHSGRVDLEWNTNSQVTEYRVDTEITNTNELYASSRISAGLGPRTTATILNLTNGTGYTFTVVAVDGSLETSMPSSRTATPVDDGEACVTILPSQMNVREGGSRDYTVRLETRPTADVLVTVRRRPGSDPDLSASPDTLTFTDLDWDMLQTVTVSAAEDDDGLFGVAGFTNKVTSFDIRYDGIGTRNVTADEIDNDKDGVTVSPQALRVPEGGSRGYTVKLNTQPETDVIVSVTRVAGADPDLSASPDTLTFTYSSWDKPQTVRVSAAEDADQSDGRATFEHYLEGFDSYYTDDLIAVDPVRAAEVDNDKDVIGPTAEIQTEASAPVGSAFEVTIRFSENVRGFTLRDIGVSNGTASNFNRVSSWTYTVTITPEKSGEVRVEVRSNVALDRGDNGNQAAEPLVIEVDLTRPEVEITSEATGAVSGAVEVTITFSEAVTGLGQSEITVTNGTVSSFSGSGTSYTVEITPSANGTVTVEIAADVAEDAAGNGNRAAEPFVIEADLERPAVTIEGPTEPVGMAGFEVTIAFAEPVEGFEPEDIQVSNGMVADFTEVSSSEYRATIKPAEAGQVVVEVPEGVAEDRAGNGNRAAEPFEVEAKLVVSYQEEDYTATEGGER